jgi:NitT/TauT family transport system permease protein
VFGISQLILPTPGEVLRALNNGSGVVPSNLAQTLYATIIGFAIGLVAGVAVAVLVTEVRLLERTLYPLTVGFQSMPLIGLAPLMIIWFGFGIEAHAAMASIVVFFPIFTNMVHGLERIDAEGTMLFKSLGASRWQTFVKLKFPSALPYLFAGTDVGIVFAMLGVIVAEFLGANQGMGFLLVQYSNDLDTAGVFEVLIILAVVGLILHSIARGVGKMVLHAR